MKSGIQKSILVADDSLYFRERLSEILEAAGHKVRAVNDGEAVKEELAARSGSYDVLLLDLKMPGADGFEVLDWMEDNNYLGAVEVMVVTGAYETEDVTERLRKQGVTLLLSKEVSPEELVYSVNRLLYAEEAHDYAPARVPLSAEAEYRVEGEVEARSGWVLNVNESGLYLKTELKVAEGAAVTVSFDLPGVEQKLHLKGKVVWSTALAEGRRFFRGAGVHFTGISRKDRDLLKAYMEHTIVSFLVDNQ